MGEYRKAIAAFITSLVGMLAVFGIEVQVPEWVVPITSVVATTFFVYWIPNKHVSKNVQ